MFLSISIGSKRFFGVLLFLLGSLHGFSSTERDSLLEVLEQSLLPKDSVDILNEISDKIHRQNPTQSGEYAQQAFNLAEKIDYPKGIARSLVNLAGVSMLFGKTEEALVCAQKAIDMGLKFGFEAIIADALHKRGLTYQYQGDYAEALINYHESIRINQKLDRKYSLLPSLNNIALVRRELKDYDIALDYLSQFAEVAKESGHDSYLRYSKINAGYIYFDQGKYQKALTIVDTTLQEFIDINDTLGITIGHNMLGEIHLGLENFEKAITNSDIAIGLAKRIKYRDGIINAVYTNATTSLKLKKYQQAINKSMEALSLIDTTVTTRYIEGLLNTLVDSYKALGKETLALEYSDQLLKVKEKIFSKDRKNLVFKLEVDNRIQAKEKEKQLLLNELKLNEKILTQQTYLTWLIAFVGFLFFVVCFFLYYTLKNRNTQKASLELAVAERTWELEDKNEKLQIANEELERFAYVTSHDLKEPLRNIMSFAQLLAKRLQDNKEVQEYTTFITSGTRQLYDLIENILEFSRVNKHNKEQFESIDLNDVVEKVKFSLPKSLEEKNAEIQYLNLPQVKGNASLLYLAFKNLIENGIKFNTSNRPIINISYQQKGEYFQINCKDNGIGISQEYYESIFEMFKRLHNQAEYKGSGMGLAICRKIIHFHGGEMWVSSQENQGSTFSFTLKAV